MHDLAVRLRASADVGFLADSAGRVTAASRGAELAVGALPGELDGLPLASIVGEAAWARAASGDRLPLTLELRDRRGGERRLEGVVLSLRDADGAAAGWLVLGAPAAEDPERRRREDLCRALFEHGEDALLLLDPDTLEIRDANALAPVLLGRTKGALIGRPADLLVPTAERARLRSRLRQVRESGPHEAEEIVLHEDGRLQRVDLAARAVDVAGRPFLLARIRAVAPRSREEQEGRQAKDFLDRLQETSADGLAVVGPDGRMAWANRGMAELAGAAPGELAGRRVDDLCAPEEAGRLREAVREAQEGGSPRLRVRLRRGDGAERTVELGLAGVLRAGERHVFVVAREGVGEEGRRTPEELERRVEERTRDLRQSEERFRLIAESLPVAMAITRAQDGMILYANEKAAEVLRIPRAELTRHSIGEFYADPQDRPRLREAIFRDGGVANWEFRLRRGDGTLGWGLTSLRLTTHQGEPAVLGVFEDLSEFRRTQEALRESEERYRTLAESSGAGFWQITPDGRTIYMNGPMARMLGVSGLEEMEGRTFHGFFTPESLERIGQEHAKRHQGISSAYEAEIVRADGSRRRIMLYGAPLQGPDGTLRSLIATVLDVTERRKAEEALRESEERFRQLAEHLPQVLYVTEPDLSRVHYLNPAYEAIWGRPAAEVLKNPLAWTDAIHPQDRPAVLAALNRNPGQGRSFEQTYRILRPDGSVRWVHDRAIELRDEQGRTYRIVGIAEDVTERRGSEQALQEAHDDLERRVEERTQLLSEEIAERRRAQEHLKLYREIFANAQEGIVVADGDGRIREQNDAHRRLSGYADAELVGRPAALVVPEDAERVLAELRASGRFDGEVRVRAQDGTRRLADLTAFSMRGAAGEAARHVLILRDVSARRRAELAFRSVVEGTAGVTGEPFFRSLARHLAGALGVRWALVSKCLDQPPTRVRTLAFWAGSAFANDAEYDLAGTPCEKVLAGEKLLHESRLAELYPADPALAEMGALSYMGLPLTDDAGTVLGHLAVLDDKPMEDADFRMSVLRVFAARAGAELVRQKAEAALRASEDRWRSLVASLPGIVVTIDRGGTLLSINRTLKGYDAAQVVGTSAYGWVRPEDVARLREAVERVFERRETVLLDVQGPAEGGGVGWWEDRLAPIVVGDRVEAAVLVATDITSRKEAEQRLQSLAEEQRLVVENMRDFLYRHDVQGVFTFMSPSVEQVTGYTVSEWMTHYTEYMTDSPMNQHVIDFTEDTLRTGRQSPTYLVEIYHKQGHRILLEVNERATFDEKGQVSGVVGIARDVTERRRAEEELRLQKTLLESVSEAALEGILVVSEQGRMIAYNRRFVEMWDLPREILEARKDDLAVQTVQDRLEDPKGFLERVKYLYHHPAEESHDEIRLKDGRVFDRYSAPVRSRDGVHYGRVWFFRDITGRTRTERELRRAAEETRRAYDDLKTAQAQLIRTEKLASIGMLVSGVAHEINNPLNVMYGNLQLLAEVADQLGPRPGARAGARKFRGMIRDALKAAEHARAVMEDFRAFARDTRTAEPVDVNRCLEEAVSLIKPALGRRIRVVKRLGRLPLVRCLRGQLSQVFLNLLKNAVEAIEKKGTIRLRTSHKGGVVRIEVSDTGRGVSLSDQAKLFEPFFTTKAVG
ncbi:MAG TPA: PAS domain S-box protein, partial [Planctomycetota bacterium]|nr:PAS domain S-box protein [Planctomycetota bacterium]